MSIILSSLQQQGVASIEQWFKGTEQTYVLAGYAGTGKTFLVRHIIDKLGLNIRRVAFATFTGKAALVLTQKAGGEYKCGTLHSLLYKAVKQPGGGVFFTKKPKEEFDGYSLIVVDECSMVSVPLLKDLYDTGKKILFIGDHGQLPPVGKVSDIYKRLSENPNFTLTEIHRQAEGSPIIHLSMLARTKKQIDYGSYDKKALVIRRKEMPKYSKSIVAADMLICARNDTRFLLNQQMRSIKGITSETPVIGDKIVCRKNNWEKGLNGYSLVNGMVGYIETMEEEEDGKYYNMNFRPEFMEEGEVMDVDARRIDFLQMRDKNEVLPYNEQLMGHFEFGYAVTCHTSQGSQWNKVFVVNEVLRAEGHARWLYTAITRAAENLILAL